MQGLTARSHTFECGVLHIQSCKPATPHFKLEIPYSSGGRYTHRPTSSIALDPRRRSNTTDTAMHVSRAAPGQCQHRNNTWTPTSQLMPGRQAGGIRILYIWIQRCWSFQIQDCTVRRMKIRHAHGNKQQPCGTGARFEQQQMHQRKLPHYDQVHATRVVWSLAVRG